MYIVLALKSVSVPLFVMDTFHLNRRMEKFVLATKQVGYLRQSLERLRRHDVASHGDFAHRNGPNVQIMNFVDVFAALPLNILSHLLDVDGFWHAFHHDDDDVLDDGNRCEHHNDREKVRADRVKEPPVRKDVDDDGSDNDSDTHNDVTENVQEGCIH